MTERANEHGSRRSFLTCVLSAVAGAIAAVGCTARADEKKAPEPVDKYGGPPPKKQGPKPAVKYGGRKPEEKRKLATKYGGRKKDTKDTP